MTPTACANRTSSCSVSVVADQYREALEDLDRLRDAGKVTPAAYELHKSRLLAEAESKRGRGMKALVTIFVVIAVFLVILFVSNGIAP